MPDLHDRLNAALAGHYAIERELGSGGMATVWLAKDLRYGRAVAVKVLRPDLSATLGSDRFLREIRITAQLNHPHILPLLDSGEADGLLFYVMPYVAGGSLRDRLRPGEPLPLDAALHVTTHVAAALDHAHRQGVVHRDVKPENVLFSDGEPIVADFGIARAVSTAGGSNVTRTGVPLGTPGYMSPEQATGGARLDARTDVFGLGCVAYEMLVGATPEVWPTGEEVRLGRFVDAPPAHRAWLDRLPGRVEQVLARSLAIRPADRFATPGEFADALEAAAVGTPRLSEAQVHAVLRRAAELQAGAPTADGTPGAGSALTAEGALTIGAVEQVAAQVGIPPEHVRQAVRDLVAPVPAVPSPFATAAPPSLAPTAWPVPQGKPGVFDRTTKIYAIERNVEREVTAAEHSALVLDIHEMLQIVGHGSAVGDALTWSPAAQGAGGRRVVVSVTPAEGRTRIRVEERLNLSAERLFIPQVGAAVGALLGVIVVGMGGVFGHVEGPLMVLPIALLAGFGAMSATRIYQTTLLDRRGPELRALAERLEARIAQRLLPPPAPAVPSIDRRLPP